MLLRIRKNCVIVKSINERICLLRIKTRLSKKSIINVYAHSDEKDDIGKNRFYQIMERAYGSVSNTDMQMEAGDLNVN